MIQHPPIYQVQTCNIYMLSAQYILRHMIIQNNLHKKMLHPTTNKTKLFLPPKKEKSQPPILRSACMPPFLQSQCHAIHKGREAKDQARAKGGLWVLEHLPIFPLMPKVPFCQGNFFFFFVILNALL